MFGKKNKPTEVKEGMHVFTKQPDGKFSKFIIGVVTGVDKSKIGVNGIIVDPVGLKNKVEQGKAGSRSIEILEHPTSENCIFALIYRTEHENFTEVLDVNEQKVEIISPRSYSTLDGWIRESLPELLNNVLSLAPGSERDQAKRLLRRRMDTLTDKDLKRTLYSICRSLKILN